MWFWYLIAVMVVLNIIGASIALTAAFYALKREIKASKAKECDNGRNDK